jgi:hypothetical protein
MSVLDEAAHTAVARCVRRVEGARLTPGWAQCAMASRATGLFVALAVTAYRLALSAVIER